MDTRTKIVRPDRIAELAASGANIVSGHFDPLVAALAEQLAALKRASSRPNAPLVVLIRSSRNPILPARARAELVAALSVVDYVCEDDAGIDIQPEIVLDQEHELQLNQLIQHVHSRQEAGTGSPVSGKGSNAGRA